MHAGRELAAELGLHTLRPGDAGVDGAQATSLEFCLVDLVRQLVVEGRDGDMGQSEEIRLVDYLIGVGLLWLEIGAGHNIAGRTSRCQVLIVALVEVWRPETLAVEKFGGPDPALDYETDSRVEDTSQTPVMIISGS
jgi:hypothetical protein